MTTPSSAIERLRTLRGRKARDLSIGPVVAAIEHHADKIHHRLGELVDLWERLVPAWLVRHTALAQLRAGVLHVDVDSSSAAFELDRRLRSGLAEALRAGFRGTLVRVKLRIANVERANGAARSQPPRRRASRSRGG